MSYIFRNYDHYVNSQIHNKAHSCWLGYSIPNVLVSSTASSSFSWSISSVGYGGRSSRLKQVWARGRLFGFPHFSMQNFLGPTEPRRAAKPSYGMLDVPVTNWTKRSRCSLLNLKILKIALG